MTADYNIIIHVNGARTDYAYPCSASLKDIGYFLLEILIKALRGPRFVVTGQP